MGRGKENRAQRLGQEARVVFLDASTFGDVSLDRFKAWPCTVHGLTSPGEIRERLKDHNIAVVNKVVLDHRVLSSPEAGALKLIAVAATGTDNIDLDAARERGIRVCNVPGYGTWSVAQFTIALMLELATRACGYQALVRAGAWQKSGMYTLLALPGTELYGKTLGIVGYGRIGRAVAGIARAMGMKVLISARKGRLRGRVPFDELLKRSDVVSLHCPLTPETKNLLDRRAFSLMKPTAFLVNTARGGLIDEAALIDALREKRLRGAALDVLSREPPEENHPVIAALPGLDNLIVTPHCAWTAREARQRLLDEVADNIEAFAKGKKRNVVA